MYKIRMNFDKIFEVVKDILSEEIKWDKNACILHRIKNTVHRRRNIFMDTNC